MAQPAQPTPTLTRELIARGQIAAVGWPAVVVLLSRGPYRV